MLAAAAVVGLATACQVIAPRLRIPSLILLLPVGFAFGLLAPQFRMDEILGSAFPAAVDLIVAVILLPQGIAYGPLTGYAPINGLWSAAIPLFLYGSPVPRRSWRRFGGAWREIVRGCLRLGFFHFCSFGIDVS